MSAEWTFFIFVTMGTLVLVLAPEVWAKAFLESGFGRWLDSWYSVLVRALVRFYDVAFTAPARWIERKVNRG